ncbi:MULTISPECIES: HNH endonuclease [unclassified Brevundimonas]|uniref:HNH endonuclease n=1 Tax=unclassified Brevundimonas TaxID=2622653 RepID=UPI003F93A5D4
MAPAQLIPGLKYSRLALYTILGVPEDKRKGDWLTGYTRFNDAFYVFATVGVPGRTGHDYSNYWEDDRTRLVWEANGRSHIGQPQVQAMVGRALPVHIFTRTRDREPFEYQGIAIAETVRDTRPVCVTWVFELPLAKPPALLSAPDLSADIDPVTEGEYLRAQRLGQAKFRSDLLKRWSGRCAVTQIAMPEILRASHIKAWRDSTAHERINPHNGLLLAVHLDGLFDRGFLSFGDDGSAILSNAIAPHTREAFALHPKIRIPNLSEQNRHFLSSHRVKYGALLGLN